MIVKEEFSVESGVRLKTGEDCRRRNREGKWE